MKTPPLLANAAADEEEELTPPMAPDLKGGGAPGRGGGTALPDFDDADADADFGSAAAPVPASDRFPPSLLMRFMCGCGREGG